ncbi:hypothetical protein TNCT_717511 [Trichonephila clavata]|uniref:Uncharacterized protein n=1 Tax=Trichonephila clavata TaxID=2740835 RepID=A0A8X6KZ64_TRICU|nr:hypothetical protein TNCT_717511 [Trichonephila clavata]
MKGDFYLRVHEIPSLHCQVREDDSEIGTSPSHQNNDFSSENRSSDIITPLLITLQSPHKKEDTYTNEYLQLPYHLHLTINNE